MKKTLAFISITLVFLFALTRSSSLSHAQKVSKAKSTIPSDLLLDLKLAQQNPAPNQKQIVSEEVSQVVLTTSDGQTTTVTPEPSVAPGVMVESSNNAIDPQLTTSEQVVTEPVTVEQDQNGNSSPSAINNADNGNTNDNSNSLVPGTDVVAPDDNAASIDNSTNPDLPAPTVTDENITPTPAAENGTDSTATYGEPTATPDNSSIDQSTGSDTIPLESQPQDSTSSNQDQPTDTPTDNSSNQTSGTDTNSTQSDTSSTDQSNGSDSTPTPTDQSVQGAAIGPESYETPFQQMITNIEGFFTGK